jgi:hypothetical protein
MDGSQVFVVRIALLQSRGSEEKVMNEVLVPGIR